MIDKCEILKGSKTIAIVGYSRNPSKTANVIANYLHKKGFKVAGINPAAVSLDEIPVFSSLKEVPFSVDIVDVFLPSEKIPSILKDVLEIKPKTLWLQLGITSVEAKIAAENEGINFIENDCIKVRHTYCS